MVKALVTGGAGFIGSHLVGALRRKGVEVRVLDDLSTGKRSNLPKGVELLVGDVADPAVVERACRGVSVVFHLAAIASVARSIEDPLRCHEVNQGGTINVFEAAGASNRKPRVIYACSAAVYGRPTRDSLDEGQPTVPLSPYGADKRGSELHAAAAREVARVHSVRSQRADARSHGIALLHLAVAADDSPPSLTDPKCRPEQSASSASASWATAWRAAFSSRAVRSWCGTVRRPSATR